jgi:GGDEF domain-containing protein
MALTTLRKFLTADKPQPPDLLRFLQLLLEGIATHAVESDATDLKLFRIEMSNFSDTLKEPLTSDQMLMAIRGAIRSLEAYNGRAAKLETANRIELRSVLTMMTDTIAFLGASSKTDVERLQLIEKSIDKASAIDDIRSLRVQLAACLASVRNESVRVREAMQFQIDSLQAAVQRSRDNLKSAMAEPPDPATGLPGRASAEQSIANKIAEGRDFAIALFLVDRLVAINGRYGRPIGDQILLTVAQHLGQEHAQSSSLFRWSGPAFIQVFPIDANVSSVERLVKKLGSVRLQKDIDTGGGSVMLAITCSWILEIVTPLDSVEMFCRKLDDFVAARSA